MANPLYQMYGQPAQQKTVLEQLTDFKNSFQGDPKAQVMNMLNSGQVSQAEYNAAVQQANQLYSLIGGRR